MTDYQFKTPPRAHQLAEFERSRDAVARGTFWEMGLGKSWLTINVACDLFARGKVDCVVAVAPKSVVPAWAEEWRKHAPDSVLAVTKTILWSSDKAHRPDYQEACRVARTTAGFLLLVINYEGALTELGEVLLDRVLKSRKCMLVLDESDLIKTPGADRTRRLRALGRRAAYRRILTGTLLAERPTDAYSQVAFLDPAAFAHLGISTAAAFRSYFCIIQTCQLRSGGTFPKLLGYRNLPALRAVLEKVGDRRTKAECLDLPEKTYAKRYFELTPEQEDLYQKLKEEFVASINPDATVTAPLAIQRLLRFQQITHGFVVDDDGKMRIVADPNPRTQALREVVGSVEGQFLVWCRFQHDIHECMRVLKAEKIPAASYFGETSDKDRELARSAFATGSIRALVMTAATSGRGLTLVEASTAIYYGNSFRLVERLQSEDRNHRIGQKNACLYVDIVAPGTIDEKVLSALREKRDVAAEVTGDKLANWI